MINVLIITRDYIPLLSELGIKLSYTVYHVLLIGNMIRLVNPKHETIELKRMLKRNILYNLVLNTLILISNE